MAIEYRWTGGESGEYVPVEVPDPVIPVAQGIAGVLPAANQAQVADTAVNPNIGVMNDTSGLAGLAQQQMQDAGAQTAGTTAGQQTAAATPDFGGYTEQQIKNVLDWQAGQTDPLFGWNIGERLQKQGIDRYSPEQIKYAVEQLKNADANERVLQLNAQFGGSYTPALTGQYGARGHVYSSSDPSTGAIMFPRIGGGIDVVFPDGTKKSFGPDDTGAPLNQTLQSYKGPTTGDYGVTSARGSGPWSNPDWKTAQMLRAAANDAQRESSYYSDLRAGNVAGPGGLGPAPTRDPYLKSILGNLDPVTALRAANLLEKGEAYYARSGSDPAASALAASLAGKGTLNAAYDKLNPYSGKFPSGAAGVAALAAQQLQNAAGTTPAPTTPPAPTKTASGVTVKDYQGNQFDTGITLNLAKQIGSAFDPKKSSGAAFTTQGQSIGFDYDQAKQMLGGKDPSAAQQVLLDISRSLQQKGVNDLSQIGVRTVDVEQEGYNGTRTEKQREFYNKETGERIAGENESIGQTFTGQGATYYNLDVGPDGKPTFTTKAASTSDADVAAMALPLLLGPVAQAVLGASVPSLLGGALNSAGITGLAGDMIAKGLMSGATSSLFGGDFLKGALSGAISPVVSAGIGSVLPTGFAAENPAIAKFLTSAGTSAVQGALSGKNVDFGQMLQNAALSSAIGAAMDRAGMMDKTGIPANLAPLLVSLARSGTITPQAAMQMITQMGRKG